MNMSTNPKMASVLRLSEEHSTVTFPAVQETSVSVSFATINIFKIFLLCLWEVRRVKYYLSLILFLRSIGKFGTNSQKFFDASRVEINVFSFSLLEHHFFDGHLFKSDCL